MNIGAGVNLPVFADLDNNGALEIIVSSQPGAGDRVYAFQKDASTLSG